MKKVVVAAAILTFAASAFAKAPKVNGWKDVAKIADKEGFEVVSDYTDYYVAKSKDGKNFAFLATAGYSDGTATLAMSCVDGEVFSKTTIVVKGGDFTGSSFSIYETDKKCMFRSGPAVDLIPKEFGLFTWTVDLINQRKILRSEVSEKYGVVIPANIKKADNAFGKLCDSTPKTDFGDKAVLQKLINSFFEN